MRNKRRTPDRLPLPRSTTRPRKLRNTGSSGCGFPSAPAQAKLLAGLLPLRHLAIHQRRSQLRAPAHDPDPVRTTKVTERSATARFDRGHRPRRCSVSVAAFMRTLAQTGGRPGIEVSRGRSRIRGSPARAAGIADMRSRTHPTPAPADPRPRTPSPPRAKAPASRPRNLPTSDTPAPANANIERILPRRARRRIRQRPSPTRRRARATTMAGSARERAPCVSRSPPVDGAISVRAIAAGVLFAAAGLCVRGRRARRRAAVLCVRFRDVAAAASAPVAPDSTRRFARRTTTLQSPPRARPRRRRRSDTDRPRFFAIARSSTGRTASASASAS